MKLASLLTLPILLTLATCMATAQPTQESDVSTPLSTPEDQIPCAAENWSIAITAVDQTNLEDGTKLIFARIGIENNDSLWGRVSSSDNPTENETSKSVFLTTNDGSIYESLDSLGPDLVKQLPDPTRSMYQATGQIETPLLPPGFVTLGKTIGEKPSYYNFAFQIPNSKTPKTITIGNLQVECILPYQIGENGEPIFRKKTISLPSKTYDLGTDAANIHDEPSARRYPNLVGAELERPDGKETIFITNVTRNENGIIVTFDFTNFSSHDASPSFDGYIMGNSRLFICPGIDENGCEQPNSQTPVQPSQTAQDLTWSFMLPENETNLMFVYIYGGNVDLNEVYRINLE